MAEETIPAVAPIKTEAPAFDPKVIQDSVKGALRELANEMPAPAAAPAVQAVPDPVKQMIEPYVAPALAQVAARAESAMDAATFYNASAERDLKDKHRAEIEEVFNNELRRGNLTPREAIWSYLKGGKLQDEILDYRIKQRQAAEEAARFAQTAGPGSPRPMAGGPARDAFTMTHDELTKALENASF